MSNILVVGSLALDSVETPFGRKDDILGGAALYASTAASFFAPVSVVGVVGDDYPLEALDFLRERGRRHGGRRDHPRRQELPVGRRYEYDMNSAETLDTQLGVFADFSPQVPEAYRTASHVFLANITPSVQSAVLDQVAPGCFVMADTMNFWINSAREDLLEVLARVDLMLLNDAEIRQLTGTPNLAKAAREVLAMGPRYVVIKKGEYGATLVSEAGSFTLPCYPLQQVLDPTGAGDTFAGGFVGYLAWAGSCEDPDLRQATAIGTVMASRVVESFGLESLAATTSDEIYARYFALKSMVHFEELPAGLEKASR